MGSGQLTNYNVPMGRGTDISTARMALEVLIEANRPLRLDEIRVGVLSKYGKNIKAHSLRAALYYHLDGEKGWFDRAARGLYEVSSNGRSVAK